MAWMSKGAQEQAAPTAMDRFYIVRRYDDGAFPIYVLVSVDMDGNEGDFVRRPSDAGTYWSISPAHLRDMTRGQHLVEWTESMKRKGAAA